MSDYISKEELKERLVYCRGLGRTSLEAVLKAMDNTPTLDEKEIIRKPFERVVERLEEQRLNEYSARAEYVNGMNGLSKCYCDVRIETLEKTIQIVKEECGINE